MKHTIAENLILYVVIADKFGSYKTKDRLTAYVVFDRLEKKGYNNIVLKKVTTNVETEYLERG